MPNKRLSKEENQPAITTLLPNCTNKGDIDWALPSASAKSVKADNPGVNVSSTTGWSYHKHATLNLQDKEFIEVEFKQEEEKEEETNQVVVPKNQSQ